jgi:cobalt/nickel transport system permease protein
MGAGHSHALYVHRHSPVHALAPEVKIAASVLFTVAVVATPREALWAFGGYLAVIVAVALVVGNMVGTSIYTLPASLAAAAGPFGLVAWVVTAAGYLLVATLLRVLPRTTWALTATAVIACVVSVTVASQGFVLQYYLGGAVDVGRSLGAIAAAMAGTHVLIGLGEGVITAFTVTYVAKVRPDLVYSVRNQRRPVTREAVSA